MLGLRNRQRATRLLGPLRAPQIQRKTQVEANKKSAAAPEIRDDDYLPCAGVCEWLTARGVLVTPCAALKFMLRSGGDQGLMAILHGWESGQVVVCFAEGVLLSRKTTISARRNANWQVSRRLTGERPLEDAKNFISQALPRWLNLEQRQHRLVVCLCVAGGNWTWQTSSRGFTSAPGLFYVPLFMNCKWEVCLELSKFQPCNIFI
jgi:hypothetical protein